MRICSPWVGKVYWRRCLLWQVLWGWRLGWASAWACRPAVFC
ncbi:hypothetical protein BMETH_2796_0 [methanotrophic bacterial endosymbiont of Bathymodiolus sp.]|nr:hypothetical protein BMETH_2796_0 [methanotrophic bacterial endosymbiont of Bathymodiolus sp.]